MSAPKYYLSHDGNQVGPWSVEEILAKVTSGELTQLDYLYDESKEDWVSLIEFEPIAKRLAESKPKAPPKSQDSNVVEMSVPEKDAEKSDGKESSENAPAHMTVEWYILKGENKFGPFSYPEVIQMLQQKVVFEFDFAWNSTMNGWHRIAEISDFDTDNIKKLQNTLMPEISEVFFRRRHRRVQYGGTVLIHDNNNVWKGRGVEISSGGAGVIMENSMVVPGQTLYLHFKPGDGVPPFNAVCEVVSKKFEDGVHDKNAPVKYGLKFININNETKGFLQEYTKKGVAA